MSNWMVVVRQVIAAELPDFEIFTTLTILLDLDGGYPLKETKTASQRMASLLDLEPATCLTWLSNFAHCLYSISR